jgi:hypothetical protein
VPPSIFKMIAIILLVLAVALVILAVARRLTRDRPTRATDGRANAAGAIEDQEPGQENALAYSATSWTSRARQLASAGDFKAAIRALYLALLVHLHRSELIVYDRWTTNWEYEAMLASAVERGRGSNSVAAAFAGLTEVFDIVWYGNRDAHQDNFERCLVWVESIGRELGFDQEDGL